MKKYIFIVAALGFFSVSAQGQIWKKIKNKVSQTISDRSVDAAGNATNKAIDNGANAVKNGGNSAASQDASSSSTNTGNAANTSGDASAKGAASTTATIQDYKNFDFVPGDTVIFQSQLADEQVGEIPSQFTLSDGQMDIQTEDGENVIHVPKGPGAIFTPRMTSQTYMPDQFTVEFDFKNESFGVNHVTVDFGHRTYYSGGEGITPGIAFGDGSATWTLGDVSFPENMHVDGSYPMVWHHIAVAINKNVGKAYIDQYRVVNVNNLTGKPNNVTIVVNGYENSYIKNIRIAKGGIDIYKQTTTPTRIVMHGILFDVDKSTLKPESMGSINEIYHLMTKNPSVRYEIDGHTDNSGDAAHNLTLSQQRADAVKAQLVSMGIADSRLATKGYGDTKPIDSNDTPEGKANNRRVEFIKL